MLAKVNWRASWKRAWLCLLLLLYLGLSSYNLGLPGLHYDEAKEAGVNAVELLTNEPLSPFRGASLTVAGTELPLMVQDYIGAINVYLAYPFLKLTGIGVPNLRFLSVILGLLALLTLERAISTWVQITSDVEPPTGTRPQPVTRLESGPSGGTKRSPISLAGLITITLLAASPSFIFWSRQGIFVTNVIQPLSFGFIWLGLTWTGSGRTKHLLFAGLLAGLALYGKLLAIWVIFPFGLYILWRSWKMGQQESAPRTKMFRAWLLLGLMALLPLIPLILFNMQTGGTASAFFTNAAESYYGVDNSAYLQNLSIRLTQVVQVLRGQQFWYLGGVYANSGAPWLALGGVILGLVLRPRQALPWLLLIVVSFAFSLFTISDLFITHYALIHPLLAAAVGLGLAAIIPPALSTSPEPAAPTAVATSGLMRVVIPIVCALVWLGLDLSATVGYHRALAQSGGLADHSDATYALSYHLRYNGLGAPILLDWGMDAPVRFLSEGTVRPVEIFGYGSPAEPDADLPNRIGLFINNPDNVYLLHSPGATVFQGRREIFFAEVTARGLESTLEKTFEQRNGTPLFELWRVTGH